MPGPQLGKQDRTCFYIRKLYMVPSDGDELGKECQVVEITQIIRLCLS